MKKLYILLIIVLTFISCQKEYEKGKTVFELGQMYSKDKELYDYHKAITSFEKAIKNGETKAYYELAQMYMSTKHFYPRDYRKAKEYLELSIKNGDKRAYSDLGLIEMKGLAGEKNELKAKAYFEKSGIKGYLVILYGSTDSKIRDYTKAFDTALKYATKEDEFLNDWLGYFYEKGLGTVKDLKKSQEYYNKTPYTNINNYKPFVVANLKTQNSNVYRVEIKTVVSYGNFITVRIPPKISGRQNVSNLKTNIKPATIKNNSVSFKLKPNVKKTEIIISVDVELINNEQLPNKLDNPWSIEDSDLLETAQINSKDKSIEKIAKSLKRKSDIDTLANIAYFTSNSIARKDSFEEKSALYALKNKIGDCTEFSYIFASLARNLGYPTKIITGYCLNNAGHMWNEVYTKEFGWIKYDSIQNSSSFLNGYINSSIIMGNEKTLYTAYGGDIKDFKISIDLIK